MHRTKKTLRMKSKSNQTDQAGSSSSTRMLLTCMGWSTLATSVLHAAWLRYTRNICQASIVIAHVRCVIARRLFPSDWATTSKPPASKCSVLAAKKSIFQSLDPSTLMAPTLEPRFRTPSSSITHKLSYFHQRFISMNRRYMALRSWANADRSISTLPKEQSNT